MGRADQRRSSKRSRPPPADRRDSAPRCMARSPSGPPNRRRVRPATTKQHHRNLGRLTGLGADVDNDARGTSLLRRIEELAARAADEEQPPPEGPVLAAALTGLRAELGGLRADLGTLRADLSAVRAGVDASAGKLTGSMS